MQEACLADFVIRVTVIRVTGIAYSVTLMTYNRIFSVRGDVVVEPKY